MSLNLNFLMNKFIIEVKKMEQKPGGCFCQRFIVKKSNMLVYHFIQIRKKNLIQYINLLRKITTTLKTLNLMT